MLGQSKIFFSSFSFFRLCCEILVVFVVAFSFFVVVVGLLLLLPVVAYSSSSSSTSTSPISPVTNETFHQTENLIELNRLTTTIIDHAVGRDGEVKRRGRG